MAKDSDVRADGNGFTHFFDWIDRKLTPAFGPPHLSAGEDDPTPIGEKECPLCGHIMNEHMVDHSTPNTVLVCPTGERLPLKADNGLLDEFGMPASAERIEKVSKRH